MRPSKQVILIMTDTQRADMLGCYDDKGLSTPHIDKLAQKGMRFTKAYTCQPVCGPARSAIFTGTFPHSNGCLGNSVAMGDNVKTIGQRLHDQGIHTAYIGKWHLDGGDYFGLGRCPDGWDADYWYDMRTYLEELTREERIRSRKTAAMEKDPVDREFTFGYRCSDRAIDFLSRYNDEDFFLTVSYDEPHGPYLCPEPYASMYKDYAFPKDKNVWDNLSDKPEIQRAWAGETLYEDKDKLQIYKQYFFGCNSFVDSEIGRVLSAADKFAPNALIIYTSDHGDFLWSHSLSGKGPAMYDEITRIPFIVRYPGITPENSVNENPVSHIDIAPTIMEYMGIPVPKLLEGKSLTPTLRDKEKPVNEQVFIEFTRFQLSHDGYGSFQPMRCIYDGRYKLVINLLDTDELYDLMDDPSEIHNLILDQAYTTIRNTLHDRLLNWMNDTRDVFRGYHWERRPWREDAAPVSWMYTGYLRQREHTEYEPAELNSRTGLELEKNPRSLDEWK